MLDAQPAAPELVAADERVVGEERAGPTRTNGGIISTVEASTSEPMSAPRARSQAGVSPEE